MHDCVSPRCFTARICAATQVCRFSVYTCDNQNFQQCQDVIKLHNLVHGWKPNTGRRDCLEVKAPFSLVKVRAFDDETSLHALLESVARGI